MAATTGKSADARSAILSALALVAKRSGPGADASDGTTATIEQIPSAQVSRAVDALADAASADELMARRTDLKALCATMVNWYDPAAAKATKSTMRAAAARLTATRPDGAPLYAHGTEVLAFTAIAAPLLGPDRLVRVIEAAEATGSAYAPIRYPSRAADKLNMLIGHYPEARRELLITSLWELAHDGRWWDHTQNLGGYGGRRRVRGRARDRAVAQIEADIARIADGDDGVTDAPTDVELLTGVLTGDIPLSPETLGNLSRLRITSAAAHAVGNSLDPERDDPDVAVMVSQLVDLSPTQRPVSPIPAMLDALEFLLPEDRTEWADELPDKPKSWADLYPAGTTERYLTPRPILELHGKEVPGHPGVVVEVVRSQAELFANRDYMGNCTGGFDRSCQQGTAVLLKLHCGGQMYNASLLSGGGYFGDNAAAAGDWRVGEVNSRHNRGGVPDDVRAAAGAVRAVLSQAAAA